MKEVKTINWSSKQLQTMFNKETIRFDSYVQRNKCWDNKMKSLLVRTILNGFPRVPEIYATRDSGSKIYQCLDGQQRLTTIIDFMNDDIVLDEIDPVVDDNGTVYELSGKKFSELDDVLKDIILSYIWRVAYYDDLSDDEIAELFYLINNSKPLSPIEHVRCLTHSLRAIQLLGGHELFTTSLTEKAFEKYTHEDLVIKSYIMLTSNMPCLDNKHVRGVMEVAEFTEDDIYNLTAVFDRILNTYKRITFDEPDEKIAKKNKRIAKRLITRTHMLSVIPMVKRSLDENVSDAVFTAWVMNFFSGSKSVTKYEEYNTRCTSGSASIGAIKVRLDVVKKDYEEFMKTVKLEPKKNEDENVEVVNVEEVTDEETDTESGTDTESETNNETDNTETESNDVETGSEDVVTETETTESKDTTENVADVA